MFRDAGDGKFNIFTGERVAPATTVDITGSGYTKGDLVVGDIDFTLGIMRGSIIPVADDTYDIGSASNKIRDIYVSESSLWKVSTLEISESELKAELTTIKTHLGL